MSRTGVLSLIGFNLGRTGMCKTNKSKFLAGWIKGIILGTRLFSLLGWINKLLLEHVGLPNILDLAVHLVNFLAG